MKTTTTSNNIKLAQELLEIRKAIKDFEKREKELKEYFCNLMDTDSSLKVGTAVIISKHEQTRTSFDNKLVESFILSNGHNPLDYKKTTTFNLIKISA